MASEAAPHLDATDDGPASPAGERLSRAHEVSAELEAIFGKAVPEGRALAPSPVHAQPARRRRRPRDGDGSQTVSLTSIGAVLAAALVGIAGGSLLGRAQHARPAAAAPAAPSHPASLPIETLPPIQPPQEIDAALSVPQAADEAPAKPVVRARPTRTHVRATHRLRAAHACCSVAEVQAADRSLRAAYADAVRSGVPRGEIVAARNRWSAARRHAPHDPARVVASYHEITDDLNRASRRARTYARAESGRFHPRYAAWWR